MTPKLITQKEAAAMISVSPSYLRASSCPKRLLPSLQPNGRPLVRYCVDEVMQWANNRSTKGSAAA